MEKYTISVFSGKTPESIGVMARAHEQHIWNQTTLIGVSKSGIKKLDRFFADHRDDQILVDAGPYQPIVLIGYRS